MDREDANIHYVGQTTLTGGTSSARYTAQRRGTAAITRDNQASTSQLDAGGGESPQTRGESQVQPSSDRESDTDAMMQERKEEGETDSNEMHEFKDPDPISEDEGEAEREVDQGDADRIDVDDDKDTTAIYEGEIRHHLPANTGKRAPIPTVLIHPHQSSGADSPTLTKKAEELLWEWGIRANLELRILICRTCQQAIHPITSRIISHLQDKHTVKGKTIRKKHPGLEASLDKVLRDFPFADPEEVRFQPADRAPIPGIPILEGFHCPITLSDGTTCRRAFPKATTLYNHVLNQHKDVSNKPKPQELSNYPCDCQTIFSRPVFHFRVKTGVREEPENCRNVYSTFIQGDASKVPGNSTKSLEALKNEDLPSILRATQWHEYIKDYRDDPNRIVDLICYPKGMGGSEEGVLGRLPKIADKWMAQVRVHWVGSTPNMKKFLNGFPIM